jgi:hypothetical protein
MADDSYQKHQIIHYKRCFPISISEIQHNFMQPDPVKFTASFLYELVEIDRQEPPNEIDPVNCIAK